MGPASYRGTIPSRNRMARLISGSILFTLFFSVIILFSAACRSNIELNSQRPKAAVETGGKFTEWEKEYTPVQLGNGLVISICNDDANLYILFSPDWRYKKQLHILAKMTLWLDETGKGSKRIGFAYDCGHFPANPEELETVEDMPLFDQMDARQMFPNLFDPEFIKKMTALSRQVRVIDRVRHHESIVPADGSMGPKVVFSTEWGDYTYRWRIPLKGNAESSLIRFDAQPGQVIGIGVDWEPKRIFNMQKIIKKQVRRSFGRRAPGRMEPMPPINGFPPEQSPRKRKAWFRIALAQKE